MSDSDVRGGERHPATLRIKLRFTDETHFIERYSMNISRGGVFLGTRTPKPVGTWLRFEFQLEGGLSLIRGEGSVVWVSPFDPARPEKPHGMGVRFLHLDEASQRVIERALQWKERRRRQAEAEAAAALGPGDEATRRVDINDLLARSREKERAASAQAVEFDETTPVVPPSTRSSAAPAPAPAPVPRLAPAPLPDPEHDLAPAPPPPALIDPFLLLTAEVLLAAPTQQAAAAPPPPAPPPAPSPRRRRSDADPDVTPAVHIAVAAAFEDVARPAANALASPVTIELEADEPDLPPEVPPDTAGLQAQESEALPPPPLPVVEPTALGPPSPPELPALVTVTETVAPPVELANGIAAAELDVDLMAALQALVEEAGLEQARIDEVAARARARTGALVEKLAGDAGELDWLLDPPRPEPLPTPSQARSLLDKLLAARSSRR